MLKNKGRLLGLVLSAALMISALCPPIRTLAAEERYMNVLLNHELDSTDKLVSNSKTVYGKSAGEAEYAFTKLHAPDKSHFEMKNGSLYFWGDTASNARVYHEIDLSGMSGRVIIDWSSHTSHTGVTYKVSYAINGEVDNSSPVLRTGGCRDAVNFTLVIDLERKEMRYYENGVATAPKDEFPTGENLSKFTLCQYFAAATSTTKAGVMDYVRIYNVPSADYAELLNADATEPTRAVVRFSAPLKSAPAVTGENAVSVTEAEGIPNGYAVELQNLDFEQEYSLGIEAETIEGEMISENLAGKVREPISRADVLGMFADGYSAEKQALDGLETGTVAAAVRVVNERADSFDGAVIFAVYDDSGVCIKVNRTEFTAPQGADEVIEAPLGIETADLGAEGKIMVWTGADKMLPYGTNAAPSESFSAESRLNAQNSVISVTASGYSDENAGEPLCVLVEYTAADSAAKLIHASQRALESTQTAVSIPLCGSGAYAVAVNSSLSQSPYRTVHYYMTDSDAVSICAELNSCQSGAEILSVIGKYDLDKYFDCEIYSGTPWAESPSDSERLKICDNILKNKTAFSKISDFYSQVYMAGIVTAIEEKTDSARLAGFITSYGERLGIAECEAHKAFVKMSDSEKSAVAARLANYSIGNSENLIFALTGALVTEKIYTAESHVQVSDLIAAYNTVLGLDLTDYEARKTAVCQKIVNNSYANVTELSEAFRRAVADCILEEKENTKPNPGTGGGGGGGGGSAFGGIKPADTKSETDPSEPTDENGGDESKGFEDLGGFEWAEEYIKTLCEKGIISGKSEREFAPADSITRAELTKLLVCAVGLEPESGGEFSDVSADDWFAPYIGAAYRSGLIMGIGNGAFGANDEISRQDAAVIVWRALGAHDPESGAEFSDSSDIEEYAAKAVSYLAEKKIVGGDENGSFLPRNSISRAEAAKIVYGLLAEVEK